MKNNNQKYLAKAAYFIPYALCADMSDEELKVLVFDTCDYMEDFPEIKMLYKCHYVETKNGSIAKISDHIDYIDKWQFEKELKERKIKFLVIPSYPDYEDEDHDFAKNLESIFAQGVDIFDVEEHYYFNPERDADNKLFEYFESLYEIHCKHALVISEITESDLDKLHCHEPLSCCLFINHSAVEGSMKEYIQRINDEVQLLSIDFLGTYIAYVLYENKRGEIMSITPQPFERTVTIEDTSDFFCDIMNGEYSFIIVPSLEMLETSELFKENTYSILNNDVIIYGLKEKKGLCPESTYVDYFTEE